MSEPSIQNLDSVDIVGAREDGGVNLFIVSSSRLDGSVSTQQLIKDKLEAYLDALAHPGFQEEFGIPHTDRTSIILACVEEPAPEIVELIDLLRPIVERHGASLAYRVEG